MLDYNGSGMSVMEMSHRSKVFDEIIQTAEADLRDLLKIPDNYKVLFLQGGASQQFAMIPMNLMKIKLQTILWPDSGQKAWQEAQKYGTANKIASSEDKTFSYIPDCSDLPISPDADYVYICENNTIYGTKYKTLPNTKGKILVSDVSSCFLSEPMDIEKYGIVYGGVQKTSDRQVLWLQLSVRIWLQKMYFRELQPCWLIRHMQMQIPYTIHQTAMVFTFAEKYLNGWKTGRSWSNERT